MGIIVDVYRPTRPESDCTNGGISSRHAELTVVNAEGPFTPTSERPAIAIVENGPGLVKAVVVLNCADEGEEPEWQQFAPGNSVGPMMGGNYVGTSDGRFSRLVEEITGTRFYGAVAVHDRYETPEQYAALSE